MRRRRLRLHSTVISLGLVVDGCRSVGNDVVCYTITIALKISWVGNRSILRIIVVWFGVFQDDIPCVQETGDVSETAKCEVDYRVGRADANFDPYCRNEELTLSGTFLRVTGRFKEV